MEKSKIRILQKDVGIIKRRKSQKVFIEYFAEFYFSC